MTKPPPPLPTAQKPKKSGFLLPCLFIALGGFAILIAIGIIALIIPNLKVVTAGQDTKGTTIETSRSYDDGYEDGFIVGEARHHNSEPGLDSQRLELMSRINAKSHAEGGGDRSENEFKRGFLAGYSDGFAGLSRGGGQQAALPELPIRISRDAKVLKKELGPLTSSSKSPYDELADMVAKDPAKDLYVVTASHVVNQNAAYHKKFVYDAVEMIFLKLERTNAMGENSYVWVISFDTKANQLNEQILWATDSQLRQKRSQHGKAHATTPLVYLKDQSVTAWP